MSWATPQFVTVIALSVHRSESRFIQLCYVTVTIVTIVTNMLLNISHNA
jgi:hypothetical protein